MRKLGLDSSRIGDRHRVTAEAAFDFADHRRKKPRLARAAALGSFDLDV